MYRWSVVFNYIYLAQISAGNTLVEGDKSHSFHLITIARSTSCER